MNMRYAKLENSIDVREKLAEAGDI